MVFARFSLFNEKKNTMKRLSWLIVLLFLSTGSLYARSLYKIEGNDVIIDLDGIGMKSRMLKIELWSPRTVKLISGLAVEFSTFQGLYTGRPVEPIKFKVGYAQNNIEIATSHLLISVQEDGLARIFNREGNKLLIESDRKFIRRNEGEETFRIGQRFFLNPNEHIYGFGQDLDSSRFCIRNQKFDLIQDEQNVAFPIFYSEKGYALLWDNYSSTRFTDARSGLEIESEIGDEIQYFFMYGPDWETLVREIRDLTGKVPMLPYWAYAHWFLPESGNPINRLEQYRTAGIPVEDSTSDAYDFYRKESKLISSPIDDSNERMLNVRSFSKLIPEFEDRINASSSQRFCIPTHTNYPGIQKYGTFLLPENVPATWNALSCQVRSGMNLSLSGQAYWSTPIGGNTGPVETLTPELLLRWYQFAAFTPVFTAPAPDRDLFSRTMGSNSFFEAAKKSIQLRYQLLPYIYSLVADVVFDDKTLVRSLLFDFMNDEKVHEIDQQFMFGNSIMVCPVTAPDLRQMLVYFPAETEWYDFWTGGKTSGGESQNVPISTDHIPLFVKSGTILPLYPPDSPLSDSLKAIIELRIYPGSDGAITLYEDQGYGMDYRNGQSATILLSYSEKNRTLTIDNTSGTFPGMLTERSFHVVLVDELNGRGFGLSSDPVVVPYKGKRVRVKL